MTSRTTSTSHVLSQIPLLASPHISLPSAVTLPYSYQTLPHGLPPPSTGSNPGEGYIVSPSGTVSQTPEAVLHSIHTLLSHIQSERSEAEEAWNTWERGIQERELMEKRRVAPGWLDTGVTILEPVKAGGAGGREDVKTAGVADGTQDAASTEEGNQLDQVFGKMAV
ncbi:hypothetical protein BZA77DRAFT_301128 [Pyronema omphalodes]|nr:hypothetical protein BZA77DRAFT_301128 [Pyronema omphalodes]